MTDGDPMKKTNDILHDLKDLHFKKEYIEDKSGVKTVEIINACFLADHGSIVRPPNYDYIEKEIEWYESQSLNVNDIKDGAPAIWQQVASDNGYINSNYGWMMFSEDNFDQYDNITNALLKDKNTRQAIAIYTRPNMHYDSTKQGMSDFCCTSTVQYLYRDGKLNAIVTMRSNDAIFGYNNDVAWQRYILNKICTSLRLDAGDIFWNVGSLHVYERHFDLLSKA